MSNSVSSAHATARGIGFTGLLQVAFIVLKLCKVIDWSWWLVLLPIILSFTVGIFWILVFVWLYKAMN